MRSLFFFLLVVVLLCVTANADEVKCHFCGESITGDYYVFESGLTVCKECYQSSPKCALCSVPMKEFRTVGGKRVCLQCYDKATTCDLCGELILGEYKIFAGDRKVCSNCLSLPHKCVGCGIPLKEYHDVYGQKVCDDCYQKRISVTPVRSRYWASISSTTTTNPRDTVYIVCRFVIIVRSVVRRWDRTRFS